MGTNGQIVKGAWCLVLGAWCLVLSAAPQFAVKPYLQHPSKDAMTVIFFTDSACKATTTCSLPGSVMSTNTVGEWAQALTNNLVCGDTSRTNAKLYRHKARFTGLKPNRIYAYSVELAGGAKYENSFRTAPDRNTPIRFVSYADCETTADPFANYVSNLKQMKSREPDFVAIAGDFVARGGIQSYWDGFWRANAGDKGDIASSIPLLTVLGNHDLYDNGVADDKATDFKYDLQGETGTERYLAYFENEPNGVEYTVRDGTDIPETRDLSQLFHRVDYGPVTLIFLDTNDGDNSGDHSRDTNYETRTDADRYRPGIDRSLGGRHPDFNPGSPQYDWLTNQLADAQQKSRFTFVFNHHCPYSVGSHNQSPTSGQTGGSAQPVRILTETMVRYGVDGWYCGHDELLEHSITNGYEILPDGSKRKHTLSIYDLGCSGDTARNSSGAENPLKYWQGNDNYGGSGSYGFLETDVTTNKNGQWTCTITPVQGSSGNYLNAQIVYVENQERGEDANDLVYAEYAKTTPIPGVSSTKPSDWLAWKKPPESDEEEDDPEYPDLEPAGEPEISTNLTMSAGSELTFPHRFRKNLRYWLLGSTNGTAVAAAELNVPVAACTNHVGYQSRSTMKTNEVSLTIRANASGAAVISLGRQYKSKEPVRAVRYQIKVR